jgi:hypothetical protein
LHKRLEIQILRQWARLCSSARTHSIPSARNNAPFKKPFTHMSLSTALLGWRAPALQQPSEHQDVRKEVFQARVNSCASHLCSSAPYRIGKKEDLYRNSNQTISFHKSSSPYDFQSRTHWFPVFGCFLQERNPRGG